MDPVELKFKKFPFAPVNMHINFLHKKSQLKGWPCPLENEQEDDSHNQKDCTKDEKNLNKVFHDIQLLLNTGSDDKRQTDRDGH